MVRSGYLRISRYLGTVVISGLWVFWDCGYLRSVVIKEWGCIGAVVVYGMCILKVK